MYLGYRNKQQWSIGQELYRPGRQSGRAHNVINEAAKFEKQASAPDEFFSV
jgi:hypothetical protein